MTAHTMIHPSRATIFGQIARKDWTLNQWPLLGYLLAGLLALLLLSFDSPIAFQAALALLITAVIVVGVHLVFASVINESTNKTLPFMLSLPITFLEYSVAKMLFVVGTYLAAWLILVGGIFGVVNSQEHLFAGMLPFYMIVMGYLLVAFTLTLSVAMVTESTAWTIVIMTLFNISISVVMFAVASMSSMNAHMEKDVATWNGTALGLLGVEALLAIVLLAGALFIQSKKTEFL